LQVIDAEDDREEGHERSGQIVQKWDRSADNPSRDESEAAADYSCGVMSGVTFVRHKVPEVFRQSKGAGMQWIIAAQDHLNLRSPVEVGAPFLR
jgi:hypothetical protein